MKTLTKQIEVFSSQFRDHSLDVIFTQKSLWLSESDIQILYGITHKQLEDSLSTIFADGIFSKKQNVAEFEIGEDKKLIKCYRLGVIISLGYRIKKSCETKYIINTNRIIKNKLLKDEESLQKIAEQESLEKYQRENSYDEIGRKLSLITKALQLAHSLRKQEIHKRIYA